MIDGFGDYTAAAPAPQKALRIERSTEQHRHVDVALTTRATFGMAAEHLRRENGGGNILREQFGRTLIDAGGRRHRVARTAK